MSSHAESSKRRRVGSDPRNTRFQTADDRSPTMRQTPSMFVPIESTEIRPMPISQLFDGYQARLDSQRKQEDEIFKCFNKLVKEVKTNRRIQDDYLANLKRALKIGEEQEAQSSQESALQDAEGHEEQTTYSPIRPIYYSYTAHVGAEENIEERGSTAQQADDFVDMFNQVDANDFDSVIGPATEETERAPIARMLTPITPGTTRRNQPSLPPMIGVETIDMTEEPEERPAQTSPTPRQSNAQEWVRVSTAAPITPPNSRKKKRNGPGIQQYMVPVVMGAPPKRKAAEYGEKQTRRLYEYMDLGAREQSQVLSREDSVNPFLNCNNCEKPGCSRCRERREVHEHSNRAGR